MKNSKHVWLALCAVTAMTATVGCRQDEFDNMTRVQGNVTLTAGFEGAAGTRMVISSDDTQAFWESGDAFELFYTDNSTAKSATFTTSTADRTATTAAFTGAIDNQASTVPKYAVFPSVTGSRPTLNAEHSKTCTVLECCAFYCTAYSHRERMAKNGHKLLPCQI